MKIVVTGKGGVGKTTITGTLARLLAQNGQQVLALDVDSSPNLAVSLGIPRQQAAEVVPVQHGLTEWRKDAEGKAYVHLRQPVSRIIADYGMHAPDGVQLMVMGEVAHAGAGCRCEDHAIARGITGHLVKEADVVLMDMEPGLEHLGRGTAEHVDALLIVVEPYYRALMMADRIRELTEQLGLAHILVVANRVRTPKERAAIEEYCRNHELELVAVIPYDEAVITAEELDTAPVDHALDSPAVQAIRELALLLRARLEEYP